MGEDQVGVKNQDFCFEMPAGWPGGDVERDGRGRVWKNGLGTGEHVVRG